MSRCALRVSSPTLCMFLYSAYFLCPLYVACVSARSHSLSPCTYPHPYYAHLLYFYVLTVSSPTFDMSSTLPISYVLTVSSPTLDMSSTLPISYVLTPSSPTLDMSSTLPISYVLTPPSPTLDMSSTLPIS